MKHRQKSARQIGATDADRTAIEAPRANKVAAIVGWLVGLFSLVIVPALARAQPGGDTYGTHMMWDGGWPGMIIGSLMMILFLAAIIAVVVLLVRWLGGAGQRSSPNATSDKTPLDILKARFARGEIDKAEFEERRQLLEN